MVTLSGDYTDCPILIYDMNNNQLGSTVVTNHDKKALRIEVRQVPESLNSGDGCRLLILTTPAPCEYQGRIVREGAGKVIALHHGREKESRSDTRYKVSFPALIENLVCDDKAYILHTPLEVELVNVSKSGMRLRAPFYSLLNKDVFQIRMKISGQEKLLIAKVTNYMDKNTKTSEYGCRFLIGSK